MNVIDHFLISDSKIIEKYAVLNRFMISSDNRVARANVDLALGSNSTKERKQGGSRGRMIIPVYRWAEMNEALWVKLGGIRK